MLLLTTTSDILRLITGAAADIDVYVSFVDAPIPATPSSNVTPGKQTTPAIVTATTTTICAAPGASTARNIKHVSITNNHATASSVVDVEFFDGTAPTELRAVTLLPGENLAMNEHGQWFHRDAQNAEYTYQVPSNFNMGVTGTIAETMPREMCAEINTAAGASGTLVMQAIKLTAGQLVSNITIWSATTAAATPTNRFFALYDINRNLLAQSANDLTAAWTANTSKTLAMTAPYRVPTTGQYYIGLLQVATTIATIKGGPTRTGGQLALAAPPVNGTSSTGLTTSLPNPAAAIGAAGGSPIYASVS